MATATDALMMVVAPVLVVVAPFVITAGAALALVSGMRAAGFSLLLRVGIDLTMIIGGIALQTALSDRPSTASGDAGDLARPRNESLAAARVWGWRAALVIWTTGLLALAEGAIYDTMLGIYSIFKVV